MLENRCIVLCNLEYTIVESGNNCEMLIVLLIEWHKSDTS